ncbi:MAG TPA: TonB-dependent receptor [Caulobacteraceae bacterium]|jgi:TonB-dependent receptor
MSKSRSDELRLGASVLAVAIAISAGAAHADTAGDPAAPAVAPSPAPAAAPAAASSTTSDVVVTGFRNSLAKAITLKRAQTAEIDTILAEDIGKFPDLNLAESLQRIPGVAITREGGEGRQVTIRGLGPQYTRTTINGMEALSTIGAPDNDGGVNRTRAFDFTVFASDLFSSLTVQKTPEADLDEGSLGATVQLHTAEPFQLRKFTLQLSAQGDYNDLAGTVEPRASFLIADTSSDGKFGALFSIAYSHRVFDDNGASTVRWDMGNVLSTGGTTAAPLVGFKSVGGTNCQVFPLPAACATVDSAFHPRFPRYDLYQDDQTRVGATASLQWAPDDRNLFTLDALHSYWGGTRQEQYLEAPGFSGTGKCASATNCTSIANIAVVTDDITSLGVMDSGTFNGVDTRVEDRIDNLHTNFDQVTLNGRNQFSSQFSTDELLGWSQSNFDNPVQTTLGYDQFNVQGFSYSYANSRIPLLNFGSANLTAQGPWVLTEVRERPQTDDNGYYTGQINLHYTPAESVTVSSGFDFKQYTFTTTSLRLVNGESVTSSNAYAGLLSTPVSQYSQTATLAGSGVTAPAGSSTTWITPSVATAANLFGLYSNPLFALSDTGDLGDNAGVTEGDYGAYVQADFHAPLLGRELRGNIGVRDVYTTQNSQGFDFIAGVQQAVTAQHDYNEVLPSLNLAWNVRDDMVLRFSASRVMARPDLTSLVASTSVTVSGTQFNVKTGNPSLLPFLAWAYDLAWEWYPAHGALVSVALFRKDVSSFVTTQAENIPFEGNPFGVPDSAAIAACGSTPGCSPAATWNFSTPANTQGGWVQGLEVNYQQPFTFLPGILTHTGALANFTLTDSSLTYPGATTGTFVTNQLLGLSKYAANATLYYEDDRLSARVSAAYRSRYLTRVPGQETGTDADGFDSTFNLDASVQYTINAHLKATVEGLNLTNQYENEFNDTQRDLSYYYHETGREVLFGVRYQY